MASQTYPTGDNATGSQASAAVATASPGQSPSLYVGDLNQDVTEAQLFALFSPFGPITSIRICRDAITRNSLGYAYVNFQAVNDASNALRELNYSMIKGRECRIMWAQRDPALRRSGVGNVFVSNLAPSIDMKTLGDTFAMVGNVVSCKIKTDATGKSLGHGFVQFDSEESAQKAIAELNGMKFGDRAMFVGPFKRRNERNAKEWTNCYVKNFPRSWTDEQLKSLFGKYGEITSIAIARDPQGTSRGFGFVNFKTKESAEAAMKGLNDYPLDDESGDGRAADSKKETAPAAAGDAKTESHPESASAKVDAAESPSKQRDVLQRRLFVAPFQKKSEHQRELLRKFKERTVEASKNNNLYIKNIHEDVKDAELRAKFASYGTITSARVMADTNGASKGFGFVCFASADEAQKALAELNKTMWYNRPLYVSLAQPKSVRQEQLSKVRSEQTSKQITGGQYRGGLQLAPNAAFSAGAAGFGTANVGVGLPAGVNPQAAALFYQQQQQQLAYWQQMAMMPQLSAAFTQQQQQQLLLQQQQQQQQQAAAQAAAQGQGMSSQQVVAGGVAGIPPRAVVPTAARPPVTSAPLAAAAPASVLPPGAQFPGRPLGTAPVPRGYPTAAAGRGVVAQQQVAAGARAQQPAAPSYSAAASGPAAPRGPAVPAQGRPAGGQMSGADMARLIEQLNQSTPAQRKNLLGERLYPVIAGVQPQKAGKITGMLLEMEVRELVHLIGSREALIAKVNEAVAVLEAASMPSAKPPNR